MTPPLLYVGDKNFSSWSLRPWLALAVGGVDFEERLVPLYAPGAVDARRAISPSGLVPCLCHGDIQVFESLAIIEYVAETWPEARLWPTDRAARALARSIASEMHAGFGALRRTFSMNIRREAEPIANPPADALADVARIKASWRIARARFGGRGPFLFGDFSAADAMYAPVVTRFHSYVLAQGPEDADIRDYMAAVFALPAMQRWVADARSENLPLPPG